MYKYSKRIKHNASGDFSKSASSSLEPGIKGFLCTFNNQEKKCIGEAYNVLNKYTDQLYGCETLECYKRSNSSEPPNVEDNLENEIKELKATNLKKKRFQVIKSGAKNVLFVQTTIEDPVKLVTFIINMLKSSKLAETRFLYRLIPVQITCKAYIDDIKKSLCELLENDFKDNDKSFSIAYNRRNNNHLDRDEVIKSVATLVQDLPGKHVVNLNSPDVTIIIEIIKSIALLSVVHDYVAMKKFNLLAFVANGKNDECCKIEEEVGENSKICLENE